jgi:hypothetical protein
MKDLLLNPLKTSDLARLCDKLSIETTREIRTSRNRMLELLKKHPYRELKTAIAEL